MTGQSEFDNTLWSTHLQLQKELCNRLCIIPIPTDPFQIIGLADNLMDNPIHGLRHPLEGDTTGWYVWTGEYSKAEDYFKPVHAYHLLKSKPEMIKYLGLPVGYRFLIDLDGYEDIWYDETLLDVS